MDGTVKLGAKPCDPRYYSKEKPSEAETQDHLRGRLVWLTALTITGQRWPISPLDQFSRVTFGDYKRLVEKPRSLFHLLVIEISTAFRTFFQTLPWTAMVRKSLPHPTRDMTRSDIFFATKRLQLKLNRARTESAFFRIDNSVFKYWQYVCFVLLLWFRICSVARIGNGKYERWYCIFAIWYYRGDRFLSKQISVWDR